MNFTERRAYLFLHVFHSSVCTLALPLHEGDLEPRPWTAAHAAFGQNRHLESEQISLPSISHCCIWVQMPPFTLIRTIHYASIPVCQQRPVCLGLSSQYGLRCIDHSGFDLANKRLSSADSQLGCVRKSIIVKCERKSHWWHIEALDVMKQSLCSICFVYEGSEGCVPF